VGKLRTDHVGKPATVAIPSSDGNCILVSSLDSTVRLLDIENGTLLNDYKSHKNETYKIECCLSNDDAFVYMGSEDSLIYVWDLVEPNKAYKLTGHSAIVSSLSYHPSEPELLSSSVDGEVFLWGLRIEGSLVRPSTKNFIFCLQSKPTPFYIQVLFEFFFHSKFFSSVFSDRNS